MVPRLGGRRWQVRLHCRNLRRTMGCANGDRSDTRLQGAWHVPHRTVNAAHGKAPGAGSVVLNLMWLFLSGFWLFLAYLFAGVIQCFTIIGIPFGIQSFKLAGFVLWPFGRTVVKRPDRSVSLSLVGNVVWFVFSGLWLAIAHAIVGMFLCLTVIGIPLGIANFKMIPLAITPFGKDIVKKG